MKLLKHLSHIYTYIPQKYEKIKIRAKINQDRNLQDKLSKYQTACPRKIKDLNDLEDCLG